MSNTNQSQTNLTEVKPHQKLDGTKVSGHKRKVPQSGPRRNVNPDKAVAAAAAAAADFDEVVDFDGTADFTEADAEALRAHLEDVCNPDVETVIKDIDYRASMDWDQWMRSYSTDSGATSFSRTCVEEEYFLESIHVEDIKEHYRERAYHHYLEAAYNVTCSPDDVDEEVDWCKAHSSELRDAAANFADDMINQGFTIKIRID